MKTELVRHLPSAIVMAFVALTAGCGGGTEENTSAAENLTSSQDAATATAAAPTRTASKAQRKDVTTTVTPNMTPLTTPGTLTVQARGTLAANVGPIMDVRVDGVSVGTAEVRAASLTDYDFAVPNLYAGAKVDVVFTNDAVVNGEDRNLYVSYIRDAAGITMLPASTAVTYDRGVGAKATDGLDIYPGQPVMNWAGALRFAWSGGQTTNALAPKKNDVARFLQQATFGASQGEIDRLAGASYSSWIDDQVARPFTPSYVNFVQSKYNLGNDYRPGGSKYTPSWVAQAFWQTAATAPDQLRRRVALALHHMLMVSQNDSSLGAHSRAYANYLDTLTKDAFGNYRTLIEDIAMSPAMGLYLTHIRNAKEDPATNRMPDENFAREVMQLFTIGLFELNQDGSNKLDSKGNPIETYTNNDVMAMAKVFTGFAWGFPDGELTQNNFAWGTPGYTVATDRLIDLQRMKAYPNQSSTAEKPLFTGKAWAKVIPVNTGAADSLKIALDTLFNHPNVGPFVSRQLIQHLVTSQPSKAYVSRVAGVFANNGKGVRGDMAAVVRAILLDTEARSTPADGFGKLVEPILRVTQWMRAFGATSSSGEYMMTGELSNQWQRPLYAPSVFGYFRPGYVPPNTSFATSGATAPEFQIVDEFTTANWVNQAESLTNNGIGSNGTGPDVTATLQTQIDIATSGDFLGLVQNLNTLLYGGRMSQALQLNIIDALSGVSATSPTAGRDRARSAVYLALSSPEYVAQR